MKQALKLCLVLFLFSCSKQAPSASVLWEDFKARQEIKGEHYEDALVRYFNLLESDADRWGTHSNIGELLNQMQKPEDALKSLYHALSLAEAQQDKAGIFSLQYNLGVYYGAQKKVSEALEHYQAALEVLPASIETKTNIELLIQQQKQDQKQDQKQKEGQGQGQGDSKDKKDDQKKDDKGKDDKNKDSKDQNGKDQKDKDDKGNQDQDKKPDQPRENSAKYKPRPFKGDTLSEGDVKKILGELKNQEQKIRANFDKKEKGKSKRNEKDW